MQRAWRKAQDGEAATAPWPWADTRPVARLSAKGGEIELIVLEGGSGRTLAFAPGHLSVSALPGEKGNSIIAGHRDTHFQFLQFMKRGESIFVEGHGYRCRRFTSWQHHHRYGVTDVEPGDLLPV
jgi:sortase A